MNVLQPTTVPRHGAFEITPMLEFARAPELAERFGLSLAELENPDAMVPLPLLHELLEALVESTGDPYFGLHFGSSMNSSEFKQRVGALGLMLLSSPSLASGLGCLARYQNVFNEGDRYSIVERGPNTHICFEAWGPERLGQIQMAEKTVTQILQMLLLAEPAVSPCAIVFAHAERPGSERLTKALGLVPTFGADCTAVVVRSEDMQRPIRGADPDLFRFFDRHLTRQTNGEPDEETREPDTHGSLAKSAVRDALHRGQYSSDEIAERLGMPLRTLQRRLAAEGTRLKSIVEDVRRIRAQRLLENGMSVGEVAILLGYSGTAPFVRAFKRWFGLPPAAWRDGSREPGVSPAEAG